MRHAFDSLELFLNPAILRSQMGVKLLPTFLIGLISTSTIPAQDREKMERLIVELTDSIRTTSDPFELRQLYWQRSNVHLNAGNFIHAFADANQLLTSAERAGYYAQRAHAWQGLGNFDRALAEYSKALRIDEEGYYLFQRGALLTEMGQYDSAIADFNESLKRKPNPYTRQLRAQAYVRAGRFDDAIAEYNSADYKSPEWTIELAWLRATCFDARIRDGAQAVLNAKQAGDQGLLNRSRAYETLAAAYAETGDFGEAIHQQERALELASKDQDFDALEAAKRLARYQQKKAYRDPSTHPLAIRLGIPRIPPRADSVLRCIVADSADSRSR